MNFYRVGAKIGHQGMGRHSDMCLYIAAESMTDALKQLRRLPMVKKSNSFPSSGLKKVDEKEFILGNIYNQYYKFINTIDISEISPLEKLSERFAKILNGYNFTTPEGQTIGKFCADYRNADDAQKIQIEKEYNLYVSDLLAQYFNGNGFSFT